MESPHVLRFLPCNPHVAGSAFQASADKTRRLSLYSGGDDFLDRAAMSPVGLLVEGEDALPVVLHADHDPDIFVALNGSASENVRCSETSEEASRSGLRLTNHHLRFLWRCRLWNSQRPYPAEHDRVSYKVRVGGVLVFPFDVEG